MEALRQGLPGWRGVETLGPGSRSSNKVGGAELRPSGGCGKGSRTHATAAPGCLGPWDMAAPGRTWNADAWLSKGAQATDTTGPAALGGAGSPGWEGLQGGRPWDPLLGDRPPRGAGPPHLAGRQPRPRPETPAPPAPRRALSSAAVFTSKETFPDLSAAAPRQPTARSPPLPPAPPHPASGKPMAASSRGWIGSRPLPGA